MILLLIAEILHQLRLVYSLSHYLQGFTPSRWGLATFVVSLEAPTFKDYQLGGATHLWCSFFRDMERDRERIRVYHRWRLGEELTKGSRVFFFLKAQCTSEYIKI